MEVSLVLTRHVLASFCKQLQLTELISNSPWQFDLQAGILSFGKDLHWHAEILGTESHENSTWLWAWANTASNLPPTLIQASLQMKQLGEQHQISELTEPQLPLSDEINGVPLAEMLAQERLEMGR